MSVYSELLRRALAEDESADASLPELVSRLNRLRGSSDMRRDSASRLGDTLAYDVILVRLCDRLGIDHDLMGDHVGDGARRRAEQQLVAQMPSLGKVIAHS
jgi:hypothetical protein